MPGPAQDLPDHDSALPAGTRLAEFEIRRLLGVGGFGIVYLAYDHTLEREVAIKEYMPASMAGRTAALHVSLRSKSHAEVFALGLRSFVNEAKLLARFDHPSLIKVHRFWEANRTAYMAMPVLRGHTLKNARLLAGKAPDESFLREVLGKLLGALEQLHKEGVYHRDVSPDNVHIEAEGRPVLLDFGAARRVVSGRTQTLTAILKPAYAPIEQYAESSSIKQGPWTDLYALGATMYFMLTGTTPVPGTVRAVSNEPAGLAAQPVPGISPEFLAVIDWMLEPHPNARPQSVAELQAVLAGRKPLPSRAAPLQPLPLPVMADRGPPRELSATGGGPSSSFDDLRATDIRVGHAGPISGLRPAAVGVTPTREAGHASDPLLRLAADDSHRLPPPRTETRAGRLVLMAVVGLVAAGAVGAIAWTRMTPAKVGDETAGVALTKPAAASAPEAAASSAVAGAGASAARPADVPAHAGAVPASSTTASAGPVVPTSPAASLAPATPLASTEVTATTTATAAPAPPPIVPRARPPAPEASPPGEPRLGETPTSRCAGRGPLSHYVCMDRECARPRFRRLPECIAWQEQAARQR